MSKIVWDAQGERKFENGVSKGVLYPMGSDGEYGKGVAWNGLITVTESPEGAEPTSLYADNIKYVTLMSVEELNGTIEAYTYPDEFAACNGEESLATGVTIGQQTRQKFALCYQTNIGNDINPNAGYKINIIYGCLASPSERANETINDSPDAITMSFEFTTDPVEVAGFKPTSKVVIDSTKITAEKLALIEAKLYGDTTGEPEVLLPDAIVTLIN